MGPGTVFLLLEAVEPDILNSLADRGALPNLAAFRASGEQSVVRLPRGIGANGILPTLYTGVSPARHGRYYHQQHRGDDYRIDGFRRVDTRHETLWEAASRAGRRVAVLDLPKAPRSDRLYGIQVADWNTHLSYPGEFHTCPADLAARIRSRHGDKIPCHCLQRRYLDPEPAHAADALGGIRRSIDRSRDLLLATLREGPWDLFLGGLTATHCAGHQLWHLHDKSHPWHASVSALSEDALESAYCALDDALGKVLDALPDDCRVLLFAGAGMGPSYVRPELLEDILTALARGRRTGLLPLKHNLRSLWQRAPGRLRRLLAPLAHASADRLTAREHADSDWFALRTNDNVGGIRINLAGRQPQGRIPGEHFDAACDRLLRAFKKIRIVDTGEPLVLDAIRTDSVYRGDCIDELPDILLVWNERTRITGVTSPDIGTVRQARLPQWPGAHNDHAMLLARTPGFSLVAPEEGIDALDIAPTLAALCGFELPDAEGLSRVVPAS